MGSTRSHSWRRYCAIWWNQREAFECCLARRYDFKHCHCGTLGFEQVHDKTLEVLNRTITVNGDVVEYFHGSKHVPIALKNMGMDQCKPVSTPRVRHAAEEIMQADAEEQLCVDDTLLLRATLMRIAFMSHDWPVLIEMTRALSQCMRVPKSSDIEDLNFLKRYLKGCPQYLRGNQIPEAEGDFSDQHFVDTDFSEDTEVYWVHGNIEQSFGSSWEQSRVKYCIEQW
eukprot:6035577-Amphidinium_carterae.4